MRILKNYSDEFKVKVILELIREESSLSQIASKYEVPATTIHGWKEQFIKNAVHAINPDKQAKKYNEQLKEKEKQEDQLYKQIGKLINSPARLGKKKI